MKIIEELLNWANTLPDWQSDAVRRIWLKNDLTGKDEDELYSFLKSHVGLDGETKDESSKPTRFSKSHIGSATIHGQHITLLSLQDLEQVNAIPSSEKLLFGDKGITVIYGDNSAGKSGYSRVLKKSCRARGTEERIYPNIYEESKGANPAKATFTVKIDDNPAQPIQWEDGKTAPECLANIAVFDRKTARVYVDEANAVSYIPYGLDVFTKMASLCRSLRLRIQAALDALPPIPQVVADLVGPDKAIKSLSIKTTAEELDKLTPFNKADEIRLSELTKTVADYKANDPTKKAQALRREKGRIDGLRKELYAIANALSSKAVSAFKKVSSSAVAANKAAEIASKRAFSQEPLHGTGSDSWRLMFESAKRFSEEQAYPGEKFPVTDEKSLCVLCQQPLDTDAKDRMNRFWKFIEDDTARIAKERTKSLNTTIATLKNLNLDLFDRNPQLYEEMEERSKTTATTIKSWLVSLESRKQRILDAINTDAWASVGPFSQYPASELSKLSKKCEAVAIKSEALAKPEAQKKAEAEISTLTYRQSVQDNKKTFLLWVGKLQTEAKLREALRCVDTTQITKKGSALMEKALTQELEGALNREFESLGVDHLKMKFQRSGSIGSTYHQLQLQSNQEGKMNLSAILSEGEHSVVAIASFFAELSTSAHKCGIVFDDPVSSLDHYWRTRVAGRLVSEGSQRQVIVFTHDIVFLLELERQANENGIPITMRTVYRVDRNSGLCDPELPWNAMTTKSRIGYLRKCHQEIECLHRKKDNQRYQSEYPRFFGLLRETWERAIEEVLLNKAIERFKQGIETQRLQAVTIEDQDYVEIYKGMANCSKWLPGHDQAAAVGTTIPSPDYMNQELQNLEAFRSRVEGRLKQIQKQRSQKNKS